LQRHASPQRQVALQPQPERVDFSKDFKAVIIEVSIVRL
jgi:hypothetical protein